MKITKTQIEAVYEVAVRIFADLVKLESGVKLLQEQYQWNPTSARYYLSAHSLMMTGELFQKTISASATDYFLSRIAKDQGPLALETAVRAVRKHIKYYESVRPVTLRSLIAWLQQSMSFQFQRLSLLLKRRTHSAHRSN
ncbi:hypothetical protein [Polaromonas sp.]|uniref:hypothetical protein n=1 Tax=Polaromonas sp. TaxID=1869339 RepID=UPI0013BBDB76|nr:hypothetical protein [Polaromonas sp.]NDP62487.1 hypothetical protein [Polaromonas sp.]